MSLSEELSRAARGIGRLPAPVLAAAVHVFTALGIICNLLATIAIFRHGYAEAFAWLGLALIIDGVDGPLARAADVKQALPRYSGERLDLIIDYLSYVFVPVLALLHAGFLPGVLGGILAGLILLSSLHHFADEYSKSDDNCFVGFPAIWCLIAFHFFALPSSPAFTAVVSLACVVLTFVPTKYVHPVRVELLRPLTLVMTALWSLTAAYIVATGLPAGLWANVLLNGAAVYWIALSVWHGFAKIPAS